MKANQMKIISIAISILFVGTMFIYFFDNQKDTNLKTSTFDLLNFKSYEDFNSFLSSNSNSDSTLGNGRGNETSFAPQISPLSGTEEKSNSADGADDYSSTNIQEAGVDEPDIVKTDGSYLYVISNSTVFIIAAYPAEEAEIVSTITLNESHNPRNLFVNGDRLIIIAQSYLYRTYPGEEVYLLDEEVKSDDENIGSDEKAVSSYSYDIWTDTSTAQIFIYDISSRETPIQIQHIEMEGYYSTARMIGDFVYVITTSYAYEPILYADEGSSYIPKIRIDGVEEPIDLSQIYYIDSPEASGTLTYITSINVVDETKDVNSEVFIIGDPSIVYVSQDAIYITSVHNDYDYSFLDDALQDSILSALPSDAIDEFDTVDSLSLTDYQKSTVSEWIFYQYFEQLNDKDKKDIARQIMLELEKTTIHKIEIHNGSVVYTAQGSVPGYINNQFSISEYEGNLRVATTVNGWMMRSYISSFDSYNNVYVLDESLKIIGTLENIASGESIYSVRFMNAMCYLVTYKQIDPFFVIDLQNPSNPMILGELKIPGYSTYLHPYDEQYIIGIGKDNTSIKINLFDVKDVSNPTTIDTYVIEDDTDEYYWMYSTALYEHKAFLFDSEKDLLIIPISTDNIESAYVFNISLNGIQLKGIISHKSIESESEAKEPLESSYWRGDYQYSIKRSLYINDVIYTFSDAMIQMNDMNSLDEINSIQLI
jgi:inhibitor of cysteine peptidase